MTSNLGKWDSWYGDVTEPTRYGDLASYGMASEWLANCSTVGDWGCGKGGFKPFVQPHRYHGFDGSRTPFADQVVDLAEFRFETEGILLRHVIEHDHRWAQILANASSSFTKRLMVILFTPMLDDDQTVQQIAEQEMAPGVWIPDLSFPPQAIIDGVGPELLVDVRRIASATQYGGETIFRFERP